MTTDLAHAGDIQDILLEVFRKQLAMPECTADDDFYAVGGDSLIALRVVAEATRRGVGIELRDVLYYPTVRELADAVAGADRAASDAPAPEPFELIDPWDRELVPQGIHDAWPAPALSAGLLYLCELSEDPSLYQDLVGFEVRGRFDERLLREALAELCAQHDALRSYFDMSTLSVATQMVVRAGVEFPVEVVTLSTSDPEAADVLVREWCAEQLGRPMDWSRPPLARCHVVAQPESFRFSLVIHHSIIDGWSLARLMVELLVRYDAKLAGRSAEVAAPPAAGLRQFVQQELAVIESPEAAAHWLEQAGARPLIAARDRFGEVADQSRKAGFAIDDVLLAGLRNAALAAGTPLKSLVLAVHLHTLGWWAGRHEDVVTGVVTNGRPEIEGGDLLVGLFLNTLPMRLPSIAGTWAELAKQTLRAEREGSTYRRFPLSSIELRLARRAFDIAFNFTHFHAYDDLDRLREIDVESWWEQDKNSLPMMVDFAVESPKSGTSVTVSFDPDLIAEEQAERYAELFHAALHRAATDPRGQAMP